VFARTAQQLHGGDALGLGRLGVGGGGAGGVE
jgi:hypothetical protein